MRTKTMMTLSGWCAALLLTACDVKDPIFNTSHPDHGMVTLTTDWSGIGQGLTAPESYTVKASRTGSATTGYSATLTGVTNRLDHLFEPGDYRFHVYNTPEQITVSGTTASVEQAVVTPTDVTGTAFGPSPADNPERLVHNAPGWLFTSALDVILAADAEHAQTAPMQQQVRQLTIIIEPTGGTRDEVASITATLSGVAGTLDLDSGTHGAPSHVGLTFSKITSGDDAGKWTATVRLLGIAGTQQWLRGTIAFADGSPASVPLDSDLSTQLAAFNTDKHKPLILSGKTADVPTGAAFGATISDWIPVDGRPLTAH